MLLQAKHPYKFKKMATDHNSTLSLIPFAVVGAKGWSGENTQLPVPSVLVTSKYRCVLLQRREGAPNKRLQPLGLA